MIDYHNPNNPDRSEPSGEIATAELGEMVETFHNRKPMAASEIVERILETTCLTDIDAVLEDEGVALDDTVARQVPHDRVEELLEADLTPNQKERRKIVAALLRAIGAEYGLDVVESKGAAA